MTPAQDLCQCLELCNLAASYVSLAVSVPKNPEWLQLPSVIFQLPCKCRYEKWLYSLCKSIINLHEKVTFLWEFQVPVPDLYITIPEKDHQCIHWSKGTAFIDISLIRVSKETAFLQLFELFFETRFCYIALVNIKLWILLLPPFNCWDCRCVIISTPKHFIFKCNFQHAFPF